METLAQPVVGLKKGLTFSPAATRVNKFAPSPAPTKNVSENERFFYRSLTGHYHAYDALGLNTAEPRRAN